MTVTGPPAAQAGSYRVGDLDLNRIGYGAMQLAGPGVFGPPHDRAAAIEVLRTAVELGVNHIDTADAYGPHITNEIIREALFPYGDHVHIVTKVGIVRDERGGWLPANSPQSLRKQVHDNLRRLGLDVLDVVNLRTLGNGRAAHRIRAVLSARRLLAAAVRRAGVGRQAARRDDDSGRPVLAAAALAEPDADPGYLVGRPPAREHRRRGPGPARRRRSRARRDLSSGRPQKGVTKRSYGLRTILPRVWRRSSSV